MGDASRSCVVLDQTAAGLAFPTQEQMIVWANSVLKAEHQLLGICLMIIDDEAQMRSYNQTYRQRDYSTNILSFTYTHWPREAQPYLGDVLLCAPVIEREAIGKDLESHWAHLVIHGCLHVCGYDHEEALEAEQMQEKEILLMQQLGYPSPYRAQKGE